jgi:hypothetical protein
MEQVQFVPPGDRAVAFGAAYLLPLPSIRAYTPVFDVLCGERVGVRGLSTVQTG